MYTNLVMDHFTNPRNVGEIEDADGVGQIGNPVCGDVMRISIAVDGKDRIADVKFKTFGCGAAVATSSMVTENGDGQEPRGGGRHLQQSGGRGPRRPSAEQMHCSNLAADALHLAIQDYLVKSGREAEVEQILKALPKEREHSSH